MTTPARLPDGYRRLAFDSLGSTNAEALRLAMAGEAGDLWVTTREQTAGRGRRGRVWVSAAGNLHATLLLIDPSPANASATLSFVAGVALHRAVSEVVSPQMAGGLGLKWPNDLIASGRKVAGILVEGERLRAGRMAVIVGMGVNCRSHPDIEAAYPPGDLFALGEMVDAEALFGRLARCMAEEIAIWDRGAGFAGTRARWLDRALGFGGPIRVNLPDRVIEGRFDRLDAAGQLIVATPDGKEEIVSAGDVFFGRGAV